MNSKSFSPIYFEKCTDVLKEHGKSVGVAIGSTDPKVFEHYKRLGINMFAVGQDYAYVQIAAKEERFLPISNADIQKYVDAAMELKDEIISSKTNVTYTGTAFYVSPEGDDNNDGKTPNTAWKTVAKVNSSAHNIKSGDAVLFERGGEYRTDVSLNAPLTDVNVSAWYAPYVNWAYSSGIIDTSKTEFRPDHSATREEIADMLYRFTLKKHKTRSYEGEPLNFSDAASVTAEYGAGIAFAVDKGIFTGYDDKTIRPKNTATRAEVATILCRFADLYDTLETDFSSSKTDSHIFDAEELNLKSFPESSSKSVKEDGVLRVLKIVPESQVNTPTFTVFERLTGISFNDYPYIKIRVKFDNVGPYIKLMLSKDGKKNEEHIDVKNGEWLDIVISLYDYLGTDIAQSANDGKLILTPWADYKQGSYPKRDESSMDIEYIGFFPSKEAAESYKSEAQASSAQVKFVANEETYTVITVNKGTALTYPEKTPEKIGYKFVGWDVSEGTVVNDDLTVSAKFEVDTNAPRMLFDTTNSSSSASGGLEVKTLEENGIKYYHFEVNDESKSKDGTRAYFKFNPGDYDAQKDHYVKVGYRYNIASSDAIDLNVYYNATGRLWGPQLTYAAKDNWNELVFDLKTLTYTGGEGVEGDKKDYFEKYINGNLSSFLLKPYKTTGLDMKLGEYLDIAYIAFFDSADAANSFTYFN